MNLVYISGKVIEKVEYKFMINKKHLAKCKFKVKTQRDQIIDIIGYDNESDYALRKVEVNNIVLIEGRLNSEMKVLINDILNLC